MNNYIITVARGFGSCGKTIADTLAQRLGIQCYENRILALASQLGSIDEHLISDADERLHGGFIGEKLRSIPHTLKLIPVEKKFESDQRIFDLQADIIQQLADTESCVIVGKCADFILKNRPNVISIYIEASREFCIHHILSKDPSLTEKQADKLITKTDKYRSDYYKYYTGGHQWRLPINYDMTLNSEKMGIDICVEMIIDYLQKRGFISNTENMR